MAEHLTHSLFFTGNFLGTSVHLVLTQQRDFNVSEVLVLIEMFSPINVQKLKTKT